ncbi:MAG: matrixin family metalloprotease [Deltaproteobacteria bacterium]|nr:matrixin family metalloprotease [Deltaproteobacteria bacterium]MBI3296122.1 matrixin family metalloprotease [Deltaproteobacteria bacterium]
MKPLSASRHSIRNQVGCPGSNPAYVHWDTRFMPIPYFISIDSFRSHPDLLDGIRPSFEAWRNIDSLGVDFLPMGCTRSRTNENDGVNSIILVTDHWDFAPEAIAVTRNFFVGCESSYAGQILDSDILLNGVDHTFSLGPSTSAHDVQNILTHEIGHFLGLGHETSDGDPESTMWASADFFETKKRTPKETDSQGVRANYPMVIPKSAPYEGMDCSPTSTATFACSAVGPQSRAGVDLGPLMALLIPLSVWVRKSRTAKSDTTPTATISGAIPF